MQFYGIVNEQSLRYWVQIVVAIKAQHILCGRVVNMLGKILLFIKANNSPLHRIYNQIFRGEPIATWRTIELAAEMASMETHQFTHYDTWFHY